MNSINSDNNLKEISTYLHHMCCDVTHDSFSLDGFVQRCDWHDDIGEWDRYSRKKYIKMAKELSKEFTFTQIKSFIKKIKVI